MTPPAASAPALPTLPDDPAEEAGEPGGMEIPLDALGQPDDKDQINPPEVGDTVDFSVSGKVTRIDGTTAFVQPSTINGKDVAATAPAGAPGGGDDLASLESAAKGFQ